MKLAVVALGKLRSKAFAALADDYADRLRRYGTFESVVVRDAQGASPDEQRRREGEAVRAALPRGYRLVAVDERGEHLSSRELAARLQRAADAGQAAWAFCVGGAEGHDESLRSEADWVWSLSSLTLPHELARVLVLEQLYRAMTINAGERYHRE